MGNEIIPEQNNKFYLSICISPQWLDSKLIPDLVRHISSKTGRHVIDAYIANRSRLGFFTAKNNVLKCWSRTISAEIVPLPKNSFHHRRQDGVRVRIHNVNNVMGRKDFEYWVRQQTNSKNRPYDVYDIEIIFPKITRGSSQCILLFDNDDHIQYVQKKMHQQIFRGSALEFEYWQHPKSDNCNQSKNQMRLNENMNAIKSSSFTGKPQTSIWAKMATQR